MRVAFLCSCLEAGKDGVGDYLRQLSGELQRLGHDAAIVALHDRYAAHATESIHDNIPTLRLSDRMLWRHRAVEAGAYLTNYDPELISLQYVPYGFSDKGLTWNLGRHLRKIAGERKTHVMFHETWIGGHQGASLKDRFIGMIQRWSILEMMRQISPDFVTTSNEAYARLLEKAGISASILPLFGNIPVTDGRSDWLDSEFERLGAVQGQSPHWIFAFFGTLHPAWEPEPLFSYVARAAEETHRKVIIAGIGRLGPGEALWTRLCQQYGAAFQFLHLGEQLPERISALLAAADFGITSTPWELAGKSGTVASMVEHGLPVIVSRNDVHFDARQRTESGPELLIKMDATLPSRLLSAQRAAPKPMLPEVAKSMMRRLDETNHSGAEGSTRTRVNAARDPGSYPWMAASRTDRQPKERAR
jgi:glycosyltransferase involved in cell wall biosynthesis